MSKTVSTLLDRTNLGEMTSWKVVSRSEVPGSILFEDAPICPNLAQFNINHVGIMKAVAPYEIFRVNQSGTFMMACLSGVGEVLVDGKWREVTAGQACLLPPFVTNAFRAKENQTWTFAWVRYMEEENKKTIANTSSPVLGEYNSPALQQSILGLRDELESNPSKYVLPAWVNLIHQQVLKFAKPSKLDQRLIKIFTEVSQALEKDWTLIELAGIGNMSPEHLRRLSNQQLGRSPMQQLTFMRMMHAKNLLCNTDKTLSNIANAVGYDSQFSFSNTFLKWIGCRPSEFR